MLTDSEGLWRWGYKVLVVPRVAGGRASRMRQTVHFRVEIRHALRASNIQRVHRRVESHDL